MNDSPQRSTRRRKVIATHVQFPLVRMALSHITLTLLVLGAYLMLPLVRSVGGEAGSLAQGESATVLLYLHGRYWVAAVAVLVIVVADTIRVSHRIAGPLYRMTRVTREAAQGQSQGRVRLRKGDYLGQEAEALNGLLEYNARLKADVEAASARLEQVLREHGEAFDEGRVEGIREAQELLRREAVAISGAESDAEQASRVKERETDATSR